MPYIALEIEEANKEITRLRKENAHQAEDLTSRVKQEQELRARVAELGEELDKGFSNKHPEDAYTKVVEENKKLKKQIVKLNKQLTTLRYPYK